MYNNRRYSPAAGVLKKDRDRCTVPSCIRRPHHFGAPYCQRHSHRAYELGDVNATTVTIAELRQYRDWLDRGLRIYRDTPAVKIALRKADALYRFTPTEGHAWESFLSGRMHALKCKAGVVITPRDILIEVVSLFTFEQAFPHRLPSTVCRDIALARSVIRLGKGMRQMAPRKADMIAVGKYLSEQFGVFSVRFLQELTKLTRAESRQRERESAALADFTIPNDSPTDSPKDSQ